MSKPKIFVAIAGAAGFVSGYFICRAVNKRRNKCLGELHIFKVTPNQPEEIYSEFYIPITDLGKRRTIVLKVKKGV